MLNQIKETGVPAVYANQWLTFRYQGTGTNEALIIENTSNHPMEIVADDASVTANGAEWVPLSTPLGVPIHTWYPRYGGVFTYANDALHSEVRGRVGTDDLRTNTLAAADSDYVPTRVVLMPGELIRENGSAFATSDYLGLRYRYMTDITVDA